MDKAYVIVFLLGAFRPPPRCPQYSFLFSSKLSEWSICLDVLNQAFVFQECHGSESFRFEGLELPYLEKWTARHRLCQPLQCPEEQWGQKYVCWRGGWHDSFVGWEEEFEGRVSQPPWMNLGIRFPPHSGAAVTLFQVGATCGVLGWRRAPLCLHRGAQHPPSTGSRGGMQWCVPLILLQGGVLCLCLCPSFPHPGDMWHVDPNCQVPPVNHYSPSLRPLVCVCGVKLHTHGALHLVGTQ